MKKLFVILVLALSWTVQSPAQEKTPLRLVQTVSVPGLARKWDILEWISRAIGFSLRQRKNPRWKFLIYKRTSTFAASLTSRTHNVLPFPEMNKIYVVDGEASEIKVLDYESYKLVGHIPLTIDSDPIAYDPATKYLYVVNGGREAKTPYCLVSVVDTTTDKKLADMKLESNRLESMALEKSGQRLFVNMTGVNSIGVVEREKRAIVQTWPITAAKENVPMQYDEATHRLFVSPASPPNLWS